MHELGSRHAELTQPGEQLGPPCQRGIPNAHDRLVEAALGEQPHQVLVGADDIGGRRSASRAKEAGDASAARHRQIRDRPRVAAGAADEETAAWAVAQRRALEMGARPLARISSASKKSHSVSMLTAASNSWTIPRLSAPRTRPSFIKTSRRVTYTAPEGWQTAGASWRRTYLWPSANSATVRAPSSVFIKDGW